ncbi:MAG: helix-hairpin-helix domain-containing protein [Enterobacterales bacterium]|nr:helix-hairpin-helix domain-containing protein [Enterobacterales bacterium]
MKLLTSILLMLTMTMGMSQAISAKTTHSKGSSKQSIQQEQQVNLNKAGVSELAQVLTGVGMKKAQAIVEYRQKNGNFKAVEELASVKGIGPATIAKNYKRILL